VFHGHRVWPRARGGKVRKLRQLCDYHTFA
jgi:hypothetical protein